MEQYQRAALLLEQNRNKEARTILAELLRQNPEDATALQMMARVELNDQKPDRAHTLLDRAIALEPEEEWHFFFKGYAFVVEEKYDLALQYLRQAQAIDPYEPKFPVMIGLVLQERKQYAEALACANQSLALAPDDIEALNLRSRALLKLGRKAESAQTIEGALEKDPNDAYTHANYGWHLLERGDPGKAMNHFREALREDPDSEWARNGMAEALKSRYLVYRLYLQYLFWMDKQSQRLQWAFFIGSYLAFQLLKNLARTYEALVPVAIGVGFLMFSSWFIQPIADLVLRFHPHGKYLLDKEEYNTSSVVAVFLGLAVLGLVLIPIAGPDAGLPLVVYGILMLIPARAIFIKAPRTRGLRVMAIALAVLGALSLPVNIIGGSFLILTSSLFIIGIVFFMVAYNAVVIGRGNK